MDNDNNTSKSLEQLENNYWGAAPDNSTGLVQKCHDFRKKPIKDLKFGELRVLISQSIGLEYLVPIAISILQKDPFIDSDMYEGDLLQAVLKSKSDFWETNPDLKFQVEKIFLSNQQFLRTELDVIDEIKDSLFELFEKFTSIGKSK